MITFNSELDLIRYLKEKHKIPDFNSTFEFDSFLEKNVSKFKVFIQDTEYLIAGSPKYVVDVKSSDYPTAKTYQSLTSISFWNIGIGMNQKRAAMETLEYTFKTFIPHQNEYLSAFEQKSLNLKKINNWKESVKKKHKKLVYSTPEHQILSEPNPKNGKLYKIKKFIQLCQDGYIKDYDGSGNYATSNFRTKKIVNVSKLYIGINEHPEFSHIIWFNK